MRLVRLCLPLLFTFFLGMVSCTDDAASGNNDAGDGSPGTDADAAIDSSVDASGLPIIVPHDICALPMFKLPIDGYHEETLGLSLWGDRAVYAKRPTLAPPTIHEVFLVDFLTCNEYVLTEGEDAALPHIYDNTIVWVDNSLTHNQNNDSCNALVWYDISTWQKAKLQEDTLCYRYAKTNGDHIIYQQAVDSSLTAFETKLWRISTNETNILISAQGQGNYYDIGDEHIAWAATTQDSSTIGRDIFHYDLSTKTSTHIDSTYDLFQMEVSLWGDYIVWSGSDTWNAPPFHLALYQISIDQQVPLVQNDGSSTYASIHRNLVTYTTNRHTGGGLDFFPADVEIYDINTNESRRITTESGTLRAAKIFFPWLIVGDYLGIGNWNMNYYAIHLVLSGIADEQGNLLPGNPVITQPSP